MAIQASWSPTVGLSQNNGVWQIGRLVTGWVYLNRPDTYRVGTLITSKADANDDETYLLSLRPSSGSSVARFNVNSSNAVSASHASNGTMPFQTWAFIAGAAIATNNRIIYLNDAAPASSTTSWDPGTLNVSRIGSMYHTATTTGNSDWHFAETCVWDIAGMSEANVNALVSKVYTTVEGDIVNPRTINEEAAQPWTGKLLNYWTFETSSGAGIEDQVGTADWTVQGTVNTSGITHPSVTEYGSAPVTLYPDVEALYYGATRLDNKTNIEYKVTAGHTGLNGELLLAGTNATTNASGVLQLPSGVAGTAADPVTLSLYWTEGSDPVVDRSIIVKTTLVEDV